MKIRKFRKDASFEAKAQKKQHIERMKSKELMDYAAEQFGKVIRQIKRDR